MALGLLLGPHASNGMGRKHFRSVARKMHDRFQDRFSSTCCRVLIEPYDRDRKGRAKFCGSLTGTAAALAAELLLETRPDLVQRIQADYLASRDSKLSAFLKNLV
jgi:hypothetical protein